MTTPTANVQPIWVAKGDVSTNNGTTMNQAITAAAADYTGAGANNVLCLTAGADGARLERIKFTAAGTNVATVMRVFLNNGSANTTAANNTFLGEVTLLATTASAVAALTSPEWVPPGGGAIVIPGGFRIYIGLGTAVAAGWVATPILGQY
jgi:hypothetical protein